MGVAFGRFGHVVGDFFGLERVFDVENAKPAVEPRHVDSGFIDEGIRAVLVEVVRPDRPPRSA